LPEAGAPVDLDTLAAVPAVALFVACARDAQPGFELTEANAAAVAEICRRLDGLPLALQLAAARLTVLSPAALLARLEHRLPLLTRGPRDLPERQQTLRAAIAWSYDLLGAAEQRLFRQLAVFVGGFTLEVVEALAEGGPDDVDPLEAISTLVGQSLVFVQPQEETTPRYRMLETIREFGLERLEASGEAGQTRRRHAELLRDLAERAEPMLLGTAGQRMWMARLEGAHDNIRAALAWSMSADGVLAVAVALAGALGWFWLMSGRLQEAESWYAGLLARREQGDDSLAWAKVLHGSALQLWGLGDLAQAERCLPMRCGPGSSFAVRLAWRSRSPGWARSRPAAGSRTALASCSARARRCSRRPTPCSASACLMTCPPSWPPPVRPATRWHSTAA
jgi:predicted ATPase